jgi:hypothetical protein
MKISQRVRYQRIGEGLAAIPALQKPLCHRLKIPRFSTKPYATENFQLKLYCPTTCQVAVIRLDLSIAFVLIVYGEAKMTWTHGPTNGSRETDLGVYRDL